MAKLSQFISKFLHPTSTGINNIPSLDGVRGVAILMVIVCHFFAFSVITGGGFPIILKISGHPFEINKLLMSGSYGVRLFFFLSAFLLFMPYARTNLLGIKKVDTKLFYRRRVARILPAYLLVLFALSLAWLVNETPFSWLNFLLNLFFIHPFFPFKNDVGSEFIPGTWSLVTEVHFYLILPWIAWFFSSIKKGALSALTLMVLSFLYRACIAYITAPSVNFTLIHNILGHIDIFGLGMLAALIYVKYTEKGCINIPTWIPYLLLASGFLLISGFITYRCIHNGRFPPFISDYETLLGLSFFMIVLGVVLGPSPVRQLMEWEPLRIVGLISYSMFLINILLAKYLLSPIMGMLTIIDPLHRLTFNMTVGVVMLLIVSIPLYLYVEKPFLIKKWYLKYPKNHQPQQLV